MLFILLLFFLSKNLYSNICKCFLSGCIGGIFSFINFLKKEKKTSTDLSTDKINSLRVSLINEELEELKKAISERDILEIADALTDLLYVTYGAGHAFGIDLDKCFDEVQNSNMSKLDENGKPIYNESGKVLKGPNYFKPDLSKFIKRKVDKDI